MKLVFFLLIACAINGHAQVINLDNHDPLKNLGKSTMYFEDKSGTLSLQQVQAAYYKGQFKNGSTDILNFGNTRAAVWLNISFKTSAKLPSTSYLVIDGATLEEIDCYQLLDTGWKCLQAGSLRKASRDVQITNNYVFSIAAPLQDSVTQSVWLKIKTRNIMLVSIKMANAGELFHIQNTRSGIIEISFIGVFLTLFVFTLFLYFGTGDRTYLFYCFYIFGMGVYGIGYLAGYVYLLGDDMRILLNNYPHIFHCIAVISSILITNKFYNLRKVSIALFRLCYILMAATSVLLLLSLLGLKAMASWGAQVVGLLAPLSLLICGMVVHKVKKQPTQYFTLAWLSIIVAVIFYVLSLQGIIEYRSYSRMIMLAGITIQFLLLALALGQRYYLLLERQRKLKEENYLLVKNQNLELEKLVEKRTAKLRDTIDKLETSDSVKNKLFSIVAHDLRTPFNNMLGILSSNNLGLLDFEDLKAVINQNESNFYQLKILLDNLLHWAHSQMNEAQTRPEAINIGEMIEQVIAVYLPIAQKKQLRLELNVPALMRQVYADKNHIQLVLRNLLDNAVKFTPPLKTIFIEVENMQGDALLCVKNETTGKELKSAAIFETPDSYKTSYGTDNEKGVGLGLSLCRTYLEKNNSLLEVRVENSIIGFSFKLPYVQEIHDGSCLAR